MCAYVDVVAGLDGKLSSRCREQVTISGDGDFVCMDEIHAITDAVIVGVETILANDPHLTLGGPGLVAAHEDRGDSPHPIHVVTDSHARTSTSARILDGVATTYLLVSEVASGDRREALEAAGAELVVAGVGRVSLSDTFDALEACGVSRLMVKGGDELIFSLFETGLVSELTLYVGSLVIGGRDAPTLADGDGFISDFPRLLLRDMERIDGGVLLIYDC